MSHEAHATTEDHAAHGHHPSKLTSQGSGKIGVIAAGCAAVLAIFLQVKMGKFFAGGGHSEEAEELLPLPAALDGNADLILKNLRIVQPGYETENASVIAIAKGKILGVGDEKLLAKQTASTAVVDMGHACALPGLRDAHGHLSQLGAELNQRICNLKGVDGGLGDVLMAFETWIKIRHPNPKPGEWLEGAGWDESRWQVLVPPSREELVKAEKEGRDFSKEPNQGYKVVGGSWPDSTEPLDELAPTNPAILRRVDGHVAWVNRKALELAGITHESFDPPGGRIIRDAKGEPTGILVDNAVDLVEAKRPARREDDLIFEAEEDIRAAAEACARAGLVEVQDAFVSKIDELALRELAKKNQLPVRVYAMAGGDFQYLAERLTTRGPQVEPLGGLLTIRAVKLIADGSLGGRGAHLLAPYADDPKTSGLVVMAKEKIAAIAKVCAERKWQLCVHAIGDAANRDVLDVFESALGGQRDRRWRIEHAQVIAKADIPRFEKLGVIASMQPTHATTDKAWAEERLGRARLQGAYAWRTLLESGARLAFGSDFPVESERPLLGLYAAVTRQDHQGKPEGGWLPGEKLSASRAIALFSEGPAYASFAEEQRGKLLPGMDADITIVEENPVELLSSKAPAKILETKVVATYVAGKAAYKK